MPVGNGLRIVPVLIGSIVVLLEDSLAFSCCLNGRCFNALTELLHVSWCILRYAIISTVGYSLTEVRFVNVYLHQFFGTRVLCSSCTFAGGNYIDAT